MDKVQAFIPSKLLTFYSEMTTEIESEIYALSSESVYKYNLRKKVNNHSKSVQFLFFRCRFGLTIGRC